MTIALDSSALQQLTAALSAIHNPLTDNAIRAAAQQHIDSLKTSLAAFDLARLGLQLSTGNSDLSVRFFGLSLIEYVLRLAWDQLSLDQAHSLKSFLTLQQTGRITILRSAHLQNSHGDTFCYENSIAELRKKDLSVSLMAITVDSVVLNTVIRSDREATMNLIRADALQNEGWLHRIIKNFVALKQQEGNMEKLKLLSLDIISTVLQWIILEGVESTNVLPLVFELLGSPVHEERIAATECLASLFSRSSLVGEEKYWPVVVTPLFDTSYLLSAVFASILKLYQCNDWNQIYVALESRVLDEDGYEYLKRIADALAVFGERQLFYKQMVQKPVRFESYIELMYFFSVHPSRMVSSIVSPVWNDLASHEHFQTRFSFITPMAKQYDSMEFDNEHDKKACIDSNRVRYLDILKYFAAIQPFEVFSVVDAHIRALIFGSHEPSNRNGDNYIHNGLSNLIVGIEFGFLKSSGLIAIQFEQASTLIEHTIKYIPNVLDPDLKDRRLLAGVSGLFETLSAWTRKHFDGLEVFKLDLVLISMWQTLFDKFLEIIQSYVQSNMLLQFERIKLIEFLFALIHYSSKGFSEKSRVFSSIVEPAIHSLGDPAAWSAIPSQFRVNISVSENEKEAILKKSSSKLDLLSDSANFLEKTSNWIATIRETCYGLVGLMTGFGQKFYSIPNVSSIISNNVLSSTNFLDNKHWKSLLSTVIRPVLMNCPSTAHNEVLANIIPPFSEFIQARLDSEWKMLEVSKQGALVIASPDEDCVSNVFGGLLHIMRLKDTISCRKAIVTIIKAVPILMKTQNAAVFSFLGDSVMMSSLEVFHDGYFQEVHNEAISLMGEIYLALRGADFVSSSCDEFYRVADIRCQIHSGREIEKRTKRDFREFLKGIKGVECLHLHVLSSDFCEKTSVSEAFKQFDTKTKPKPQLVRNTRNRDVLDANDENVAVLEGLF
ncbi:hypothetical protein BCR33DRAFT_769275 [Rhizoclosmatium globosum]|uniref:Exportin-5 C-terminal domain-containing protein n=1 Tax=Rhizoclosmatium globosum TaxID=329046 RepID=A0A1Y2BU33_9FUNG|nr:hypothetical protein BCR33DRAFT_769275 [Rhizoclosmatium globosum]|eukprot:ORY38147.1 hypothetical protein BCR33DRAFT_769275 [Rhizoclosmatium globosum]